METTAFNLLMCSADTSFCSYDQAFHFTLAYAHYYMVSRGSVWEDIVRSFLPALSKSLSLGQGIFFIKTPFSLKGNELDPKAPKCLCMNTLLV